MLPDDGRRAKHVGASQSDFNVNFKTLSTLIKSAFVGVQQVTYFDLKI